MQYSLLTLQTLPHRNIFFTARAEILDSIRARFNEAQDRVHTIAICGLAGIGKTEVAIEYAHRVHNMYALVLWINASSKENFYSDISNVARFFDIRTMDEPDQALLISLVRERLAQSPRWLLILDDVEDEELIRNFIPSTGTGHVLITTRLQNMKDVECIELGKMTVEEGALFLMLRTRIIRNTDKSINPDDVKEHVEYPRAREIAELLDGFPLALDQAGAFIEETSYSFAGYLNRYKKRRMALLQHEASYAKARSVYSTWLVSIDAMKKTQPLVHDLLRLCSMLSSDAIPREILIDSVDFFSYASQESPITKDALSDAIDLLCKFSFLRYDSNREMIGMHQLLQAVIQDEMDEYTQREWAQVAVLAVDRAFPPIEFKTWELCQRYLPQAKACIALITKFAIQTIAAARLLRESTFYRFERVQYDEVERLYRQALDIQEHLQPEHKELATTYHNLALFYREQARYAEAKEFFSRAFLLRRQTLGLENPITASSLHQLGWIYNAMAHYTEAQERLEEALQIRKRLLGPEHQDIATSLNELGYLYRHQARYKEAREALQEARRIREKTIGPGHPHTAQTLVDLAWVYYEINEFEEAEKLLLRALGIQQSTLSPDHPRIARALGSLGMLYCVEAKFPEAEKCYRQALEICQQVLPPEHPLMAHLYDSQGLFYYHQKAYVEAEQLYKQALKMRNNVLGTRHPETAQTLNHLGELYLKQARYGEAKEYFEKALAIREEALGHDHPHVATCLNYLARLFTKQGDYAQAEAYYQQALRIRTQVWISQIHPRVAQTLRDLADLYVLQGRYAEAEPLYRNALAIYEQALPTNLQLITKVHASHEAVLRRLEEKHQN